MKYQRSNIVSVFALVVITALILSAPMSAHSAEIDKIHFLIPGGEGGGWDGTARGTGEALTKAGLVNTASYENMSGGGGGKAIAYMIETAKSQQETLMVNSAPIIIRSLTKVFPQSFRDLTPVAAVVTDYAAFVVPADSPFQDWKQVIDAFLADPKNVKVAGGSVRGGMDHLVAAMAFQAAGGDPIKVKYVPYDAGGKAMAGLLSGETQVLSTGLGEVLEAAKAGQVRILAMTAEEPLPEMPDIPTLIQLGYEASFANWRGFFGPPGLPTEKAQVYADLLKKMCDTPEWETVRARNGWTNLYKPLDQFSAFLEKQEKEIGDLMKTLGFLQ